MVTTRKISKPDKNITEVTTCHSEVENKSWDETGQEMRPHLHWQPMSEEHDWHSKQALCQTHCNQLLTVNGTVCNAQSSPEEFSARRENMKKTLVFIELAGSHTELNWKAKKQWEGSRTASANCNTSENKVIILTQTANFLFGNRGFRGIPSLFLHYPCPFLLTISKLLSFLRVSHSSPSISPFMHFRKSYVVPKDGPNRLPTWSSPTHKTCIAYKGGKSAMSLTA